KLPNSSWPFATTTLPSDNVTNVGCHLPCAIEETRIRFSDCESTSYVAFNPCHLPLQLAASVSYILVPPAKRALPFERCVKHIQNKSSLRGRFFSEPVFRSKGCKLSQQGR